MPQPLEQFYILAGLFLVMSYMWFLDDAFVYFRYIDNVLFLGYGLVFNQGEYVEGFTSPLWVLILAGLRACHFTYLAIVQLVAGFSFVLFSLTLVQVNHAASPQGTTINFPLAYLGFNYAVLCYFSSGIETPIVLLVASACALYIVRPGQTGLQVLLGLMPLVRPELILPFLVCLLWGWWSTKRFPVWMFLTGICGACGWEIFRIYYCADLFSNTSYVKNDTDIAQGLRYLHDTLNTYLSYFVAFAFAALLIVTRRRRNPDLLASQRLVMLAAAIPVALYVIKIGGDARHFRCLAFPFCLASCATAGVLEHAWLRIMPERGRRFAPGAGLLIALGALACFPAQLDRHPLLFESHHYPRNKINDAYYHRRSPDLAYSRVAESVDIDKLLAYNQEHPSGGYSRIAEDGWCVAMYTHYDVRYVHSLGLTDAFLARVDMPAERPGHRMGLVPLARQLVPVYTKSCSMGRGMFRDAVAKGYAPKWVVNNLESMEVIERKVFNSHNLWENLRLAFTFPPPIRAEQPPPAVRRRDAA